MSAIWKTPLHFMRHPQGAPYPPHLPANHGAFQHIAIVTDNIALAYSQVMRHGVDAISRNGPALLPASSGGVRAFKFRDPDGHPLEFLQFPEPAHASGIDHSALCASDIERSVAFYTQFGLTLTGQQVNHGAEQGALDGLAHATVDVLALHPLRPSPHVELLHYRAPRPPAPQPFAPSDLCADRLIFCTTNAAPQALRDPDGHVLILEGCRP